MGDTIIGVQFGIANPDEIVSRSVVEVLTDKTYQSGQPVSGGVFDSRFGVIENGKVCPTCKQTNLQCPGHFGHIRLARPVYLYQFIDTIQAILGMVCINCSHMHLDEKIELPSTLKGMDLFKAVKEETTAYKAKLKEKICTNCKTELIKKVEKLDKTVATLVGSRYGDQPQEEQYITIQPEMVLRCFQRISDKDVERMGINPKFSRPEWMICTVLAVPPLTVRPSVVMDDNQRMEDDLTHQLIVIVRDNQKLREKIDKGENAEIIDKYTTLVQLHVANYVDNDIKGLPQAEQRSGRPLKTLKSRLTTKTGRVRGNLMGKRVDFSARSVITPDANIELDELGVPEEIAKNLTFPEMVTIYNRDRLLQYVHNGPEKYPGAKSVDVKEEARTISLRYVNPASINLQPGDIVHRHLIDGDVVLFNRQPSLHKASMECHRVVVLPYSTFRLNVSATRPYNADFDGDEMNMHVPQSIVAATELKYLASVLRQIISPRTNTPIIQIFQDTLTGAYRISQPNVKVPEHIGMNIISRMKRPLSSYTRTNSAVTGKELISKAFPIINFNNGILSLENGELKSGILKKKAFGGSNDDAKDGIIHVIYNDINPQRCGQFINEIQNIVTRYNLFSGFSVGTSDLISAQEFKDSVKDAIVTSRENIQRIMWSVHSGNFLNETGRLDGEDLENQIASVAKNMFSTISKGITDELKKSDVPNRMVQMTDSGSKGSEINITQMMALLGQQLVAGRRIQYTLQDRTLPHFSKYDHGLESRGFVENSFIDGLRPAEFFFHAMAGREGLIDTAVKTSDSGYIQRQLVKTMEDLHVEYDGSVRNANGAVVQFVYGGDGIDSTAVESQPCELANMTLEQIYADYALAMSDIELVVNLTGDDQLTDEDLVEEIIKDRKYLVENVFRYNKSSRIIAPVNLRRISDQYRNPYTTKTDLTPAYVITGLNALFDEPYMKHNKVFQILIRYYFAPKKCIIANRLTKAMFDELMKDIRIRYIKARVHPGEMVGTLAAQSIGEPTTQLTLNTFHSAGTVKANATQGVPRIMELLSASKNPKNPSNVVYLVPEKAKTQNDAIAKMKELQKTTLRDVTTSVRIYYDPFPLSENTIVQEDADILRSYQLFKDAADTNVSPWIIRLELDRIEMVTRGIDMEHIRAKIELNKVLKIFEIVHKDTNAPGKLIVRITFQQQDTPKNALSLRFIEDKLLDTVLTGLDGIGRVYPRHMKNEVIYDENVGGYVANDQWVLDVEGTNLLDLGAQADVDPTRSFSNDIHEILEVFGIETVRVAMYEEFMEVFSSETVNYHHMITLVDTMTYPGYILSANRFGMNKSDAGVLARSSFEETAKILFNAAICGDMDNMKGVSANIMFGQKPPCGTGFVDILVDETKLGPGIEEHEERYGDELEEIEKKLEQADKDICRIEDIEMEW